ncbi:hypothetical protein PYCCODRAFT_818323 [Trametes coccinea BRFM310]|uniref:Uncharacterized protein n=1 Tax=Trametes coccinea (strain BRFM310) TaxID=1353009 RepID=A0A1Y2IET1_TRAC3|nr:hypothetical protein PYCCODRAFT_818323 [Trametes coccinea BRFM310]
MDGYFLSTSMGKYKWSRRRPKVFSYRKVLNLVVIYCGLFFRGLHFQCGCNCLTSYVLPLPIYFECTPSYRTVVQGCACIIRSVPHRPHGKNMWLLSLATDNSALLGGRAARRVYYATNVQHDSHRASADFAATSALPRCRGRWKRETPRRSIPAHTV